jgi:hypothetical protein
VPASLFELGEVSHIIAHCAAKTGVLDVARADTTATPGTKGCGCHAQEDCRCLIVQQRHSG